MIPILCIYLLEFQLHYSVSSTLALPGSHSHFLVVRWMMTTNHCDSEALSNQPHAENGDCQRPWTLEESNATSVPQPASSVTSVRVGLNWHPTVHMPHFEFHHEAPPANAPRIQSIRSPYSECVILFPSLTKAGHVNSGKRFQPVNRNGFRHSSGPADALKDYHVWRKYSTLLWRCMEWRELLCCWTATAFGTRKGQKRSGKVPEKM